MPKCNIYPKFYVKIKYKSNYIKSNYKTNQILYKLLLFLLDSYNVSDVMLLFKGN